LCAVCCVLCAVCCVTGLAGKFVVTKVILSINYVKK
jgi:hypothetical protein